MSCPLANESNKTRPLSHPRHFYHFAPQDKMATLDSSEPNSNMFSKLFGSCLQNRNGRKLPKKSATPSEDATETEEGSHHSRSQSHSRYPRTTVDNEPGSRQLEDLASTKPVITTRNEELGPLRKGLKGISTPAALGKAPELEYMNDRERKRGPDDALNQLFDRLIGDEDRATAGAGKPVDAIGAESAQAYISSMGANIENVEAFVVLEIVRADSIGQISRQGFVEGWTAIYLESRIPADPTAHKNYVQMCIQNLPQNPAYFKKVYQFAFGLGKAEPAQRALEKDVALVFWDLFLGTAKSSDTGPGPRPWKSKNVDWLGAWKRFLAEKWTRSVNKDMWNQTLAFAEKTLVDETLGFWNEDQAWPGVIDDFVLWCREEGIAKKPAPGQASGEGEGMDIEDY
ncbi:Cullin binding-domain-containing protein [Copromyces sp. CBS 386.78]|nr:Cullin binding-domain-containing protein [Copromyces sp. CBS 386.78]